MQKNRCVRDKTALEYATKSFRWRQVVTGALWFNRLIAYYRLYAQWHYSQRAFFRQYGDFEASFLEKNKQRELRMVMRRPSSVNARNVGKFLGGQNTIPDSNGKFTGLPRTSFDEKVARCLAESPNLTSAKRQIVRTPINIWCRADLLRC